MSVIHFCTQNYATSSSIKDKCSKRNIEVNLRAIFPPCHSHAIVVIDGLLVIFRIIMHHVKVKTEKPGMGALTAVTCDFQF